MHRWHNNYVDGCAHLCTFTVQDWRPLLTGKTVDALYEEWDKARKKHSVRILAYVIMPDHVHIILWAEDSRNIMVFLQRTLGQMSKRLGAGQGKLWKERPRVFPILSQEVIMEKMEYIHKNPVRRGLCEGSGDWVHSSFRQLVMDQDGVPFVCDPFC